MPCSRLTPIVNAASMFRLLGLADDWIAGVVSQIPSRSQITPRLAWCSAVLKQSAS